MTSTPQDGGSPTLERHLVGICGVVCWNSTGVSLYFSRCLSVSLLVYLYFETVDWSVGQMRGRWLQCWFKNRWGAIIRKSLKARARATI